METQQKSKQETLQQVNSRKWDYSDQVNKRLLSENLEEAQLAWVTLVPSLYDMDKRIWIPLKALDKKLALRICTLCVKRFTSSFGLRPENIFPDMELLSISSNLYNRYPSISPAEISIWLQMAIEDEDFPTVSYHLSTQMLYKAISIGLDEYVRMMNRKVGFYDKDAMSKYIEQGERYYENVELSRKSRQIENQ